MRLTTRGKIVFWLVIGALAFALGSTAQYWDPVTIHLDNQLKQQTVRTGQ